MIKCLNIREMLIDVPKIRVDAFSCEMRVCVCVFVDQQTKKSGSLLNRQKGTAKASSDFKECRI